jgi:2,3,4,5-tetrahydropyridine-2-carboxylate N-succinyltransferase
MINSIDEFKALVSSVEAQEGYRKPIGFGIARIDRGQLNSNKILQATYALVNWGENFGSANVFMDALGGVDCSSSEYVGAITPEFIAKALASFNPFLAETRGDKHQNIQVIQAIDEALKAGKSAEDYKVVFLFEDAKPQSVEAVYLKLYALSLEKAALRSLNLDGAFGILENVAWVDSKPYELDYLRANEIKLKMNDEYPSIDMVDKFPRFLSHIIPANNTRILDTSKVRMGAVLAGGTTVMPGASYINFNSGTLGAVMVEGRISSSVIVGKGSDIGGGASILGVLSGTDGNPISIGENTLLGANSTTGVPLGDGCIVDAGIAILAGTKVELSAEEASKINASNPSANLQAGTIKAREFTNLHGIHFRQDSQSGQIKAFRSVREVKLNDELH